MDAFLFFRTENIEKVPNNSFQMDLLQRILALEEQLHKANDQIVALKAKCKDKDTRIKELEAEVLNLVQNSEILTVSCQISHSIPWRFLFQLI